MNTTMMIIKTTNDHVFDDDLPRDSLPYLYKFKIVATNVLFVFTH